MNRRSAISVLLIKSTDGTKKSTTKLRLITFARHNNLHGYCIPKMRFRPY